MKEIDFLPEWYKESRRRQVHMRRQYAALALIFLGMMTYNLTATHKTAQATAELARFEEQRVRAENMLNEFNVTAKALSDVQTKADLINRIDSKIDMAALLAEMSNVIAETVVLSRVECISEPLPGQSKGSALGGLGVRTADQGASAAKGVSLGDVRFKIILAGVAATPADVAALVCRLDDSAYFREVYPSYSRTTEVSVPARNTRVQTAAPGGNPAAHKTETIETSEFEITCYLANYEEIEG